jgi:retron-type reverse transcriptase
VSQALERIRTAARQRKKERFTSLLHHIDPAMLRTAFYAMKREAAPGVDGMTWETYKEHLDRRIEDLHARVKRGAYRALPSRRSYIPKEDGSKRPLAVAALEDKIVQRATAAVLSAIYEEDFLGFSMGSGRSAASTTSHGTSPWAKAHGRADRRDQQQEGELHSRRRYPVVLHGGFPGMGRPLPGAPDR